MKNTANIIERSQNAADRNTHGTSNRGIDRYDTKLTPFLVRLIKYFNATGLISHAEIANLFDISRPYAINICNGRSWRYISI